ncbi:MAG: DUF2800 domain-containing protein [Desulfurellales bacterium]|nr:MAG: DUF2800 domain-containing protein [Desulfurellales bacterium]
MTMVVETLPAHSPLGASGAERWMNCPGSVALLKHLQLPPSDDPDYRKEGSAAHEAAAEVLLKDLETWEVVGAVYEDVEITADIAEAIFVYVDECRSIMAEAKAEGGRIFIEEKMHHPQVHKMYFGTVDFAAVIPSKRLLKVRDYKHGEGIVVEPYWNPQFLYYAYGILLLYPDVDTIEVGVVQPRIWHQDGPVRTFTLTADQLRRWVEDELVPAMNATEVDNALDAGKWCRFCPAKLVCPMQKALFGAAMKADPREIVNLSDEEFGRNYQYIEAVKQYIAAAEKEAYRRLFTLGREIEGIKLVYKKANRVLKPQAEAIFKARFGEQAYVPAKIKSPAELEKISPEAKKLVHEWAYTPQSGLTVALKADKRVAVKVQTASETFSNPHVDNEVLTD